MVGCQQRDKSRIATAAAAGVAGAGQGAVVDGEAVAPAVGAATAVSLDMPKGQRA